MTRDDLQPLRLPLIALALTLLVAASLVYFSGRVLDEAKSTRVKREAQLREARLRIQNADREREMIGQYLASYQQLARAGFVGDEQRINWLDSLRLANDETRALGVEYDIGAQKPYTYAAEFNTGKLALHESTMHLKLRLLHEEDLPRFFSALTRQGGGLFTVDQCFLRRLKGGEMEKQPQFQPNLTAECDLRWLTVKPASDPEKKG